MCDIFSLVTGLASLITLPATGTVRLTAVIICLFAVAVRVIGPCLPSARLDALENLLRNIDIVREEGLLSDPHFSSELDLSLTKYAPVPLHDLISH